MENSADPALSELLARMHWVRGLAGALVRDADRAEDLAQDAWVKALRAGPAQAASWRGWFARVMRNRLVDEGRLQGQHERFTARQPHADGGPSEEEILQQMETHEALSEALRSLPDPYRRAVFLHYFEGWSLTRIAAEDGCDKRAIEKRLRQARAMMRAHLERRAPAEHWAAGLLMLASAPQKVAVLAIAAALLAVALILPAAWILRPDSDAGAQASGTEAVLAAAIQPPESPKLTPAQVDPPALTRSEVEDLTAGAQAAPFELVFVIQDADTKAAIPNVRVTAKCRDAAHRELETNQGTTDAQGRLALRFTAPSTEAWVSIIPSGWNYDGVPAASFGWGNYQESIEFTYPLRPFKGAVSGVVRDESGAPVPGAFVDYWLDGDELNSLEAGHSVQADSEGNFALAPARFEGSSLFVAPRAAGMFATRCFEVDRRLLAEERVDGVELTLQPGRPFSVEVIDERRQPVEGARVTIWPAYGTDNFETRSNGRYRGRHQFSRMTDAAGKTAPVMIGNEPWQIAVSHPGFGKWDTGMLADEGENMLVVFDSSRSLRGVLQDEAGLPVPNADVIATSAAGTATSRSDAQGIFQLCPPGPAGEEVLILVIPKRVYAFHVEGPVVPERLTSPLAITLSSGQSLSVDLVFADGQPYDRMEGMEWEVLTGPMVRAPGGNAGSAMSWLKLRPMEDNGPLREAGFMDNRFHFSQCPPGSYRMRFSNAGGLLAEAEVKPGVKGQQVVLPGASSAHGAFHGRAVRAGSLAALTRFDVTGHRFAGQEERIPVDGWGIGETFQNAEGMFRFENLVTGWYEFEIEATNDLTQWRSGRIWIESEGPPLTVALDDVMAGELTILYPDGSPAKRCRVSFIDERTERLSFGRAPGANNQLDDRTDDAGCMHVAQLPRTMPFQIWVVPPSGPTRVVPAGALNPALTEWRITLPD